MEDPFAVFGLKPTMDLDARELERLYLQRSRDSHPDHQGAASADEQTAVLERAARLNDAYRELSDPWRRARAIIEIRDPGAMERTKQLTGSFLMEAMEMAEEVAEATGEAAAARRIEIGERVENFLREIRAKLDEGDTEAAATLLHQSRYFRKALADLEEG